MTHDADESSVHSASPKPRKPYRAPMLRVYGNVEALTHSVGNMGNTDGGTMAGSKKTA